MERQVIHLIVCDDARVDTHNFHRLDIRGILVRLKLRRSLPIRCDLCIAAIIKGFRGSGLLRIRIVESVSERRVCESAGHSVAYPRDPAEVISLIFRMKMCPLPQLGRYRVQLLDGETVLKECPFWLLPQE